MLFIFEIFKKHDLVFIFLSWDQNQFQILPWSEWSVEGHDSLHHRQEPWSYSKSVWSLGLKFSRDVELLKAPVDQAHFNYA